MKKKTILFLASIILVFAALPAFASETPIPITIHIDGAYLASDVSPLIKNGRTLLPLRASAEALDAKVDWNQDTQTAIITKGDKTVKFTLNSNTYFINSDIKQLDVAPQIINNRTLIPLRAFAEALDTTVDWDNTIRDIQIDTDAQDVFLKPLPQNYNKDAEYLIRKYYVFPSLDDSLVGSWEYKGDDDVFGFNNESTYLFVSKLSNGNYHIIKMICAKDFTESTVNMVFKNDGWGDISKLTVTESLTPIYYKGPAAGFMYEGYDTYSIKGGALTRVSRAADWMGSISTRQVNNVFSMF